MKTQRNSFRGREGFAIAVEHLWAKFGEAIVTIFVSSLLQMDVSVYFTVIPLYDTLRTLAVAGLQILTRGGRAVESNQPEQNRRESKA